MDVFTLFMTSEGATAVLPLVVVNCIVGQGRVHGRAQEGRDVGSAKMVTY